MFFSATGRPVLPLLFDLGVDRGHAAVTPAQFDRQEGSAVLTLAQAPRGRDLMMAANLDQTMIDVDAAVQALAAQDGKVGVIGFCWGGGLALRAAQVLDVDCAVAFYGTRLPIYLDRPLKAPMLAHFGAQDDHVPPEMRDAAKAYLPGIEMHLYDAGHAFANDARPSFVPNAAALAYERTAAFLAAHLG